MREESASFDRIRKARWKDGLACPRCRGRVCTTHSRRGAGGRRKYRCSSCRRAFTDLTGTPLACSRLPLTKWLECHRALRTRDLTCAELSEKIGVKLSTAWRMRKVMGRLMGDERFRLFLEEES